MLSKAQRESMKFWGKFIVYTSQVSAVISVIKLNSIELTMLSIFMLFIGCAMHEYSE
jgi:hypothetical protein